MAAHISGVWRFSERASTWEKCSGHKDLGLRLQDDLGSTAHCSGFGVKGMRVRAQASRIKACRALGLCIHFY